MIIRTVCVRLSDERERSTVPFTLCVTAESSSVLLHESSLSEYKWLCLQHSWQSLSLCLWPGILEALPRPAVSTVFRASASSGLGMTVTILGGVLEFLVAKALAGPWEAPGHRERSSHMRTRSWGVSHLSYATAGWCPGGLRASMTAHFHRIVICPSSPWTSTVSESLLSTLLWSHRLWAW